MLDEEQDVQAAQEHGVDVEEVGREDRLRLSVQERPPGLPRPGGRRVDAGVLEDLPHRRRGQPVPKAGQLAVDAPVPPARVLPCHLQHQRPHGGGGARPPGSAARIAPVGPRRLRGLDLALEHGDLVPQDEDLGILGAVGASDQGKPAEHAQDRQVGESQ